MTESKTLTTALSAEDWECLEAKAKRHSLSADALACIMLHECLGQLNPGIGPIETLQRLREIGRKMPPIMQP
jgi:hypothetical protein